MTKLNTQKGFVIPAVIAVIVIVFGVVYFKDKNENVSLNDNTVQATSTPSAQKCSNGATNYPRCNADLPMSLSKPTLSVSKIPFSIPVRNEAEGGVNMPFFGMALTAEGGDANVESIVIKKTGTMPNLFISEVSLVEDQTNFGVNSSKYSAAGTKLNSQNESVVYSPLVIKAGETRKIYLRASFIEVLNDAPGRTVAFEISAINLADGSVVELKDGWNIKSDLVTSVKVENTMPEPVITSITPSSGPIGTSIELRGNYFAGFESDKNAIIEDYYGKRGVIHGEQGSTNEVIIFKLANRYCTRDMSYIGSDCIEYLDIRPGVYKIYVNPWGKVSNNIQFVVTN